MTVKELKELLNKYDDNAKVFIDVYDEEWDDAVSIEDIRVFDHIKKDGERVVIIDTLMRGE